MCVHEILNIKWNYGGSVLYFTLVCGSKIVSKYAIMVVIFSIL